MPAFLQVHDHGVCLAVRLQPRAARNEIVGPVGNELKIQVTAPPVDAAANEALLRLLAEALACPRGAVQLVRGNTSRHKQVAVRGLSPADVAERSFSGSERAGSLCYLSFGKNPDAVLQLAALKSSRVQPFTCATTPAISRT